MTVERTDDDIAHDADRALRLRGLPESVRAVARDGDVTLTGTVEWLYLKTASEVALRHIPGVRSVTNLIAVIPRTAEIRR